LEGKESVHNKLFFQGAKKQGIRAHVRVKKKFDNLGVGRVEAAQRAQDWTLDMVNFSNALSSLKEVVSKHSRGEDVSSSESEDTDVPAHAPARAPSPIRRKLPQRQDHSNNSKAHVCDESSEPVRPVKRSRLDTHSGRYSLHAKSKCVKGYSAEDLAAILGQTPGVHFQMWFLCGPRWPHAHVAFHSLAV
jgi:Pin2-interacting protein X1